MKALKPAVALQSFSEEEGKHTLQLGCGSPLDPAFGVTQGMQSREQTGFTE